MPATFSHTNVVPGACNTCHNGSTATGKSAAHFVTTKSCDACHRTTAWLPTTSYSHTAIGFRQHRAGISCSACHTSNNEVIAWRFAAYRPDCAGCHANQFSQDPHKKTESPTIFYNVGELKDCAGSCHIYTNSTFTTIKTSRNAHHRATDGGFD